MKTIVYVDGFNLYYGCLKNSKYKWLDLEKLFSKLLTENEIIKIKYFTAKVSNISGKKSKEKQNIYLKALEKHNQLVEIFYGHFLCHDTFMIQASNSKPVKVKKMEEKGSDVNLSVHFLNDAWKNLYDCGVIVSNDSDMAESLRLVKENFPQKRIGVINPHKRGFSHKLSVQSDFKKQIKDSLLEKCQLPTPVPETKYFKPSDW